MTRHRSHIVLCSFTMLLLLASGRATQLRADTPAEGLPVPGQTAVIPESIAASSGPARETASASGQTAVPLRQQAGRVQHLAPRDRPQHTFFANAGYSAIITTINFTESTSGSLNEGLDINAGYNWTSRRGFGVGVIYSGSFISAERDGLERTSRIHYVAPEFVARQRVGRRWLFRESAGIGYGRYIRSYKGHTGSRGGVGIHETVSAEYMLTSHLGLGVNIGGQWLLVDAPYIGDGDELNFMGILRFHFGGGLRVYF